MSFISHYAIMFFFSLKQFSPFLQVVYLGKLQCVFNFCDSGPTSAFIAINTLYLSLLKLEIKQEGLWDHSPPSKTFPLVVNNLEDVFLRWKCLFELD